MLPLLRFRRKIHALPLCRNVFPHRLQTSSYISIAHGKTLFSNNFSSAVEDGLISTNPVQAGSAKPQKGTGSHRTITPEERRLIETVATDHRMHAAAIVMPAPAGGKGPAD